MDTRAWQRLACCAALCSCDWAVADEPPVLCEPDIPAGHVMANRSAIIASLERLPDSCLKSLMAACSAHAEQQFMDLGSAAVCSMGYEALLRKSFGGSFHQFMEWWQREHAQTRKH